MRHENSEPAQSLSQLELKRFQREGLLTDFQLYSAERAGAIRAALRDVLSFPSIAPCHQAVPPEQQRVFDRHLDRRLVYELCTLPQIIQSAVKVSVKHALLFRRN